MDEGIRVAVAQDHLYVLKEINLAMEKFLRSAHPQVMDKILSVTQWHSRNPSAIRLFSITCTEYGLVCVHKDSSARVGVEFISVVA